MNRTIKFRAYRPCINKMLYSGVDRNVFVIYSNGTVRLGESDYDWCVIGATDEDVIMQFTGLLDKNGKEVYEGDICSFELFGKEGFRGEVKYSNKGMGYYFQLDKGAATINAIEELEVIGNIHDNPELLKQPITHQ